MNAESQRLSELSQQIYDACRKAKDPEQALQNRLAGIRDPDLRAECEFLVRQQFIFCGEKALCEARHGK